jgi:hypothetical protein
MTSFSDGKEDGRLNILLIQSQLDHRKELAEIAGFIQNSKNSGLTRTIFIVFFQMTT